MQCRRTGKTRESKIHIRKSDPCECKRGEWRWVYSARPGLYDWEPGSSQPGSTSWRQGGRFLPLA